MPLQEHMKVISIDDHVIEHPRVFQDRLPGHARDLGPRVIEKVVDTTDQYGNEIKGHQELWLYEGREYPQFALNAVIDRDPKDFGLEPYRFDQILPGCYDPTERVKDMDLDGISAQLCFPSFPRFGGTLFLESEDWDLALLCVRAYNDFIIDEWAGSAPGRLIPMIILPLWDPQLAADEIRRCTVKGAKAITFPEATTPLGLPSFHTDHWDPVFAAAQDAGLPIFMHFGSSGRPPETAPDAPIVVWVSTMATNSMVCAADLVFSPVFHRFPGLRIGLAEGGIGWIPYLLRRLDFVWERHRWYTGINTEIPPSELFRKHIWGCFIDDEAGLSQREIIGIDHICFESDYPHSDSLWPHARKRLAEMLADVPDDEAVRIAELNARELLNLDADLR